MPSAPPAAAAMPMPAASAAMPMPAATAPVPVQAAPPVAPPVQAPPAPSLVAMGSMGDAAMGAAPPSGPEGALQPLRSDETTAASEEPKQTERPRTARRAPPKLKDNAVNVVKRGGPVA